jgi:hypothetical protein
VKSNDVLRRILATVLAVLLGLSFTGAGLAAEGQAMRPRTCGFLRALFFSCPSSVPAPAPAPPAPAPVVTPPPAAPPAVVLPAPSPTLSVPVKPTPVPTPTVPVTPITSPAAATPTPTTPPAGQASPVGYLDVIGADSHAYGWSYDPDASSQSNTVQIYVDGPAGSTGGIFGGQANADRPRPDVNKVRSVSGNHGFDWPIPARFLDGKSHSLYVYGVDLTGNANKALNGSPMAFTSPGSAPPAPAPVVTAPAAAPALAPATVATAPAPAQASTPTPSATTPVAAPAPIVGKGTTSIVSLSSDPAGQGPGFARAHWTGSKMLVFFGYSHNSTANNSVRAFDPVKNTWEYLWPNSNGADALQNLDNHASLY